MSTSAWWKSSMPGRLPLIRAKPKLERPSGLAPAPDMDVALPSPSAASGPVLSGDSTDEIHCMPPRERSTGA
eukprot:107421-Chlamydomonas_euryale.AAC.9